ncbi:MAG: hypothetical protein JNG88_08795 [Phycisphaerales bacterium]|nr:hypothetical protein [Phycisphaerales bacterium]
MKALPIIYGFVTLAALGAAVTIPYAMHERGSAAVPTWQNMVNPGSLSAKHAFLGNNCEACHTPHQGVTADRCTACHANAELLLSRQSTAFHATIGDCRGCHTEHQGAAHRAVVMDHDVLIRRKLRELPASARSVIAALPVEHERIRPEETALDCAACHANQDPHRTLFGASCAKCHATRAWDIPEFRHPSPLSTECAQCHQAPPSHYMEHFRMVSMPVAGVEHADVSQCFLCHKTNAWNDIKGVGWYKHH